MQNNKEFKSKIIKFTTDHIVPAFYDEDDYDEFEDWEVDHDLLKAIVEDKRFIVNNSKDGIFAEVKVARKTTNREP